MGAKGGLGERFARLRESLHGAIEDLTTLEINTCVKASMTGLKMPEPAHALLDVVQEYAAWLVERGAPLAYYFDPEVRDLEALRQGPPPGPEARRFDDDRLTNGPETFLRLRYAARYTQRLLEASGAPPEEVIMCERIKRNCDQLKGLLQHLAQRHRDDPEYPNQIEVNRRRLIALGNPRHRLRLDPQDRTSLRKIWELGCEQVLMQSVVQLDGDVVTRVLPDLARGRRAAVIGIHEQGIAVALRTWTTLFDVLERLLGALGGRR